MNDKERVTERRGVLQFFGTVLASVLVYYIGQQNADNATLLLLGLSALVLGVPLGCITWPPSESGRHFTLPRALFAGLASLVVVVIAIVIGHFFPDQPLVSPTITGAGLLMIMHVQAP